MTTSTKACDYLIVGGGATGMAFADSLLKGSSETISVIVIDQHPSPGGQWHDSYAFVQLHQPSASYGVESTLMEPKGDKTHRATRQEVLDYYQAVAQQLSTKYDFEFVGNATLDLTSGEDNNTYTYTTTSGQIHTITVRRRLVDARYLQPDLPISTAPKFDFNPEKINCLPVNSLINSDTTSSHYYVVIGAGKTGMDGVYYLLTTLKISPSNIVWVVPHDPWITARENIGNCMEFLNTATKQTDMDLQATFMEWEQQGRVYRLFEDGTPTKFKDATLSKEELDVLRQIPSTNLVRGQGRVAAIQDDGTLMMENGKVIDLPFSAPPSDITFVHCSAGAFNYTRQIGAQPLPVFDTHRITLQDVYGTPGFCFVGSILGKLESLKMKDSQRNAMCLAPGPTRAPTSSLGFASGDVGALSKDHGFVQRLQNLKAWLQVPELRQWLVGHRLFNLGHYRSAEDIEQLVEETWVALKEKGLVELD